MARSIKIILRGLNPWNKLGPSFYTSNKNITRKYEIKQTFSSAQGGKCKEIRDVCTQAVGCVAYWILIIRRIFESEIIPGEVAYYGNCISLLDILVVELIFGDTGTWHPGLQIITIFFFVGNQMERRHGNAPFLSQTGNFWRNTGKWQR